jgi:transposase
MYSVQQESLFTLKDLLNLSPQDTYGFFFNTLDIRPFLKVVSKKFVLGAPTQLNYTAMLRSLFIRVIERIPTIKDLRKRLKQSVEFNLNCGFTGSDRIPSEAAYSRLIQKLQSSAVFEQTQEHLVRLAFQEGFLDASAVAMDATHVESRDRQPEKKKVDAEELPTEIPKKKRGRKSKAEREKWLQEQLEIEANRPLFEKKVEEQLPCTFTQLRGQIPLAAEWGSRKIRQAKTCFGMALRPIS